MSLPRLYEPISHRFQRGGDGVVREIGVYGELFPAFQRGEMRVEPSDVYVVSYPKSGTIWMMNIAGRIISHGDEEKFNRLVSESTPVDVLLGASTEEKVRKLNAPTSQDKRMFISHCWPECLPPSLFDGDQRPKVIYVMRNPKDVAVSFYHFHRSSKLLEQVGLTMNLTFSQFLPYYMNSDMAMGSWFDHVTKWWKHREDKNVLFIKYEDVLRDRRKYVRLIAEFLKVDISDEETSMVTEATSITGMRKYIDDNNDKVVRSFAGENAHPEKFTVDLSVSHFIRKGEVGDWKNYFTVAESEMFDNMYKEKMAEMPGLKFDFE